MNENILNTAENLINEMETAEGKTIKYIKKDNGLLERQECEEKIILAEDNRQVLFG